MSNSEFDRFGKLIINSPSGFAYDFNMAIPEENKAYHDLVSKLETVQAKPNASDVPAVKPYTLEEGFDSWQQATKKPIQRLHRLGIIPVLRSLSVMRMLRTKKLVLRLTMTLPLSIDNPLIWKT